MKRKSIGTRHAMPVQPAFIIGTFNEDHSPDFAPITWVSKTCERNYDTKDNENLIIISMYGTKKTKQNTQRTGQFSINLVTRALLPLMDYFGQTSGKQGVKDALPYSWSPAEAVDAPTLNETPWVCECEVVRTLTTGESDTFFCKVKNVQADERLFADSFGLDLTKLDPVIYSGDYHSIGEHLGEIGDYWHK